MRIRLTRKSDGKEVIFKHIDLGKVNFQYVDMWVQEDGMEEPIKAAVDAKVIDASDNAPLTRLTLVRKILEDNGFTMAPDVNKTILE